MNEMREALEVGRSGFYDHTHKHRGTRRVQDEVLALEVSDAFAQSRRTYGTPRLRYELLHRGHLCGRRRVARLMLQQGLQALRKGRFTRTTDSRHGRNVAPLRLLETPPPAKTLPQPWLTSPWIKA